MNEATASPYALALALALAWDRRPEALAYFKRVAPPTLDDYALEWQTRAALWAQDWKLVAQLDRRRCPTVSARSPAGATGRRAPPKKRTTRTRAPALRIRADRRQLLLRHGRGATGSAGRAASGKAGQGQRRSSSRSSTCRRWCARANCCAPTCATPRRSNGRRATTMLSETARHTGRASGRALGLVRPGDRHGDAAAHLQRLRAALSAPVRSRSARSLAQLTGLHARADLRRDAPGKPVSQRRRLVRRRARPAADASGNRASHGDDVEAAATQAPTICSIRDSTCRSVRPICATLVDRFDGQTVVALAGYNAGPRAAARWLPDESIEPDVWIENIPVQRDAQLRAAHSLAQRGVRLAAHRRSAERPTPGWRASRR